MYRLGIPAALSVCLLTACGAPVAGSSAPGVPAQSRTEAGRWIPVAGSSYQIQYDGRLDETNPASTYDVDAFDTPARTVSALHAAGKRVVCYVDVGTWESWRPDASEFPKSVLGKPDGKWPGERWLDIRKTSVLEPIMKRRFAMCASKGFDGMDPDNLDGYSNDTGFPLTYAEQLTYDTWVAQEGHVLGLTVAQKGDNGQVADLSKVFDFAVVEQCFVQGWCRQFARYTARDALVVDVEYGLTPMRFTDRTCPSDARYGETAILKHLSLDAWIVTCPKNSTAR
jgi:hypothetical protein